ncbi:putative adenylosuccinate lyase [Mycoplasma suis KI3806]|uniref:Adenylosuccinate lyase n=1 Tax=Mycoplasma suis (strain KI_3806) TaxID=708248 RepID=F0V275_MYCS3|nr:adenylosuccinate lyase [Mycoplasma suis]CBZ40756.1 putative adenylosuccinate lyase [Mycoplasma suis KI3806]
MIKRYEVPQLEHIFSENSKYKRWSILEKEILYSLARRFSISDKEISKLELEWPEIPSYEVVAEEMKTQHDFVAFLRLLERKLGRNPASKYIHYGITSSDIIDSSNSLALREANKLLIKEIESLQDTLYKLANEYRDFIQVGRTHGRHAEPTSFGYRFAITYQELESALESLYISRRYLEVISIKGSTGTYAHIGPEVQEELSSRFGLYTISGSTQALPRNRYSSYIYSLSHIGSIINSLALTLRTFMREEINEIEILKPKDSVGSSSMPHKLNPVELENITGLTKWLDSLSSLAKDNNFLWEERDISHSSNERMSLMDAPILAFNIVTRMHKFLKKIKANSEGISKNLQLTNGLISSQSILLKLIESSSISTREEAHTLLSSLSKEVKDGNFPSLWEAIQSSPIKKLLSNKDWEDCFNLERHLRELPKIYSQIFGKKIQTKSFSKQLLNKYEVENIIYFLAQRLNWYYSQNNISEEEQTPILVISLIEGSSMFAGKIISQLSFPFVFCSLYHSMSSYVKGFKESEGTQTFEEFIYRELNKRKDFQRIRKLIEKHPRILILEGVVESKSTLTNLYDSLSKIEGIQEIKTVSLFKKVLNGSHDSDSFTDYYKKSLFSKDFRGKQEGLIQREINWNDRELVKQINSKQVTNWVGEIIKVNKDEWIVGSGMDLHGQHRGVEGVWVI